MPAVAAGGDDALREVVSAWDTIPGGAAFGTLVHTVLEQVADTSDSGARG